MRYLVFVLVLCTPVLAQCGTLTVTGSINLGQTITIDVSGAAAGSFVAIAAGDAGSSTIHFGMTSITLGVASPFILVPIGMTDAAGHVSVSVTVPANLPASAIHNHTFTVQALVGTFTMMPFGFSICTSNTATLVSGTG